ncbi:putative dipeptidyl-aminopeptidase B [Cyphellophora attinorum]|uniref:dipeptidyl-peptidase IV n=1 Tax=Cyphellophora attinorum TaxID=1664694 RepID=A0A0N1H9B6_9EURO|nr:putative dipeptidyl-aminopeptidase B [Phialophora attinorum]KPI40137.1 putative dipeptidyl-aminopeptidase B [Phialophora attinorum]
MEEAQAHATAGAGIFHIPSRSETSARHSHSLQTRRERPLPLSLSTSSPPTSPQPHSPRRRIPFPSPSNSDDEHVFELEKIASSPRRSRTQFSCTAASQCASPSYTEACPDSNLVFRNPPDWSGVFGRKAHGPLDSSIVLHSAEREERRGQIQIGMDRTQQSSRLPGLSSAEDVQEGITHEGAGLSRRDSMGSVSSASTTSLVLENLNEMGEHAEREGFLPKKSRREDGHKRKRSNGGIGYRDSDSDLELPRFNEKGHRERGRDMSGTLRRAIVILSILAAAGWGAAIVFFMLSGRHKFGAYEYDDENPRIGSGRKVTLKQIQRGEWHMRTAPITWIDGPNGEDGLVLEVGAHGKDYVVVEDIRSRSNDGKNDSAEIFKAKTLMKSSVFGFNGVSYQAASIEVSPNMKKILVLANREKVFRHSYTGLYFILDIESHSWEALDPAKPLTRVQLAQWSPNGDAIAFTRDNNLFVRMLNNTAVRQVTKDGGSEYFYGIPDWVYEEEVFSGRIATWWSRDGQYVAFLRTNETTVPEYPVEYYIQRPSGVEPDKGLEHYPETRRIKYPKSGAPNPVVDLLFYDLERNENFEVEVSGGFKDDNRLITNVLWADGGKALIQEANRVSDRIRYVLVDVAARTGKTVREIDLKKEGLGWVEPGQKTTYIPADPNNGRPHDATSPQSPTRWEVDDAPSAVDLKNNMVYFLSTAVAVTQRHLFSVSLTEPRGSIKPVTAITSPGYWTASFSSLASYISLTYLGPSIPYQKVVSAGDQGASFSMILESNDALADMASTHELPHLVYTNLTVNGATLQILERRPPHFDPKREYLLSSTIIPRRQSSYIVITVDGRGTGFSGLEHRKVLREHFGTVEPADQIAVAKHYAKKSYVDSERIAIWGWSYGGYTTLKTLEMDAGETFHYGMAVAPVTDWAFYDSIYTERYMLTPEQNPEGYAEAKVSNVTAMAQNVRFLIMHGTGDDNVHMQNTLTLLDEFDLAGVTNYDVHFWPDSDHSIYFHGANPLVWERLSGWLDRAFKGEFYMKVDAVRDGDGSKKRDLGW